MGFLIQKLRIKMLKLINHHQSPVLNPKNYFRYFIFP